MMRSLFAGVSALRYHQVRMDVIGNNIANVNTVGYKSSRVTFKDLLSQTLRDASAPQNNRGGTNPFQVGLGVNLGAIHTYHTQGNSQATGVATDLAIEGDGYFILSNGPERFYTRAGMFDLDRDGNLVSLTTGLKVLGWVADQNGVIDTNAPLREIVIPKGATIDPRATSQIVYTGNLDSRDNGSIVLQESTRQITVDGETYQLTFKVTSTGNFNEFQWTVTVTDSSGAVVDSKSGTFATDSSGVPIGTEDVALDIDGDSTVNLRRGSSLDALFEVTSDSTDSPVTLVGATYTPPPEHVTTIEVFDSLGNTHEVITTFQKVGENRWSWTVQSPASGSGEIVFDDRGRVVSTTGSITIPGLGGAQSVQITPDFSQITQFGEPATAVANSQDGYGAGVLKSFGIDANGVIVGSFSNGLDRQLGQIALATFANPAGLIKTGETLFKVSSNSGQAVIGAAGTGMRGSINSGALEMSNVDLSQEFTDMIVTQRGFQANSRVITTSDEMLQELVNLKR
ncbi:MAG: flagellar hook protein FlgE [Limnochordia bacterium]